MIGMMQLINLAHKRYCHHMKIKNVLIIGGGLMGSGIAQVNAIAGYNVTLVDQNKNILDTSKERVLKNISKLALKKYTGDSVKANIFCKEKMEYLTFIESHDQAAKKSDLIIEAIVENIENKQKLFANLDQLAPKQTIFTSNTSSLPIKDIARVTNREENFAGLHFFNPVPIMKLVEIIYLDSTSKETIKTLTDYVKSLDKHSVRCKDTPGFIVNHLLIPYLIQAVQMYERGDASKEDIDSAMKLGAGYPMGPFELLDFIGLDTTKFILDERNITQEVENLYLETGYFKKTTRFK
ncbi:hydroxyacyl-coenzyme A dehydrogenase, mitochondrial-like isoform X3 [Gordionus sp. m RMFG-2023]|uniref:hydroxyacyl-coenzyme A dehydrogenase, mitochondrial-like isoform X3 n=1 Tax=Gordionus sp. m RMFG-2023 TaxID=3053472 RepID=UPI0031FC2CFF